MSAYSSLSSSPAIADVEVGTDIDMSGHFFSFHALLFHGSWATTLDPASVCALLRWDSFLGSMLELVSCESVVSNEFSEVTKKAIKAQQEKAAACLERSLPVVTGILIWYLCMSVICGCTERWEERSAGWKRWRRLFARLFFFTQGYFVHMYGQESGEKRWAGTLEYRWLWGDVLEQVLQVEKSDSQTHMLPRLLSQI
ncbi:hypothetical protein C8J57DRAFT_1244986 [Mycena rebaudengoi]|nr:hypothetical protein C8J57DRAFT_1244986 [Mycena rebaudengoi]